jgi:hypothetical protein
MSLLHQTEEDDAFAAAHADAGLRKALRHIVLVKALLAECLPFLPEALRTRVDTALRKSHYDEIDDGQWRLNTSLNVLGTTVPK